MSNLVVSSPPLSLPKHRSSVAFSSLNILLPQFPTSLSLSLDRLGISPFLFLSLSFLFLPTFLSLLSLSLSILASLLHTTVLFSANCIASVKSESQMCCSLYARILGSLYRKLRFEISILLF